MGVGPESIEYEIISLGDSKGFVKLGYNMERERGFLIPLLQDLLCIL